MSHVRRNPTSHLRASIRKRYKKRKIIGIIIVAIIFLSVILSIILISL